MGATQGRSFSVIMMAKVVLITVTLSVASASPQLFGLQPRVDEQSEIVSSVVSTLQPAIAQAVQNALSAGIVNLQSVAPPPAPALSAPPSANLAQYDYEYKIANDNPQTYISQRENRDGNLVTGTYSYVDPVGAIVTVNYQADEQGYQETRDRQEGAVTIRAQPAGAQPSPLAGTGAGLDVEGLIRRVMASLQPAIQRAVASVS